MKADGGIAAPTAWTRQRERSNLWQLRTMRWIAVAAGRRAARLLLHPIVCYFVVDRQHAAALARYLTRALGRPATWRDVYAHLFSFASTVLDRVYLLQERFERIRVSKPAASRPSSRRSPPAAACSPSAPTSAASRRCA